MPLLPPPGQVVLADIATHPPHPPPHEYPAFQPLRFKTNGTFQISIFEDLHFGENAWEAWGPAQDRASVSVIESLLASESGTDLVVLNGDLITGENTFLENATSYLDMIAGPIAERGKTWASAYGNHDHQYNISGDTIFAREKSVWFGHSRTRSMVQGRDQGTSNYYLPVYGSECATAPAAHGGADEQQIECAPELLLWFFDSKGGFRFQEKDTTTGHQVGLQNWVDASVVDWWHQTNAKLLVRHNASQIPSLAFVHIPTYASLVLQREVGVDPHTEPGINDDVPLAPQAQGWCPDGTDGGCEYGGQDLPFMQAVASIPGLMGVFSGHDHGNTWCYKWDSMLPGMTVAGNGVNLCFGQHTGYGGYGGWERGARQILVTREKLERLEVDSWIRLESGNVVGSVSLNATYGEDRYPATENTKTKCPEC
ncbi:Metallo-dependent phosphatase-like protein [Microdochium bolleyi]|uniref:Metallo-dependent phosphatase-like protein n=1 Tax=Microdochium bolleyi TaxID=196109 RepID=A0A136J8S0_9PEZI|nr:Metallo-dependent phosphatase-like protein [Microdochium bolleyi]